MAHVFLSYHLSFTISSDSWMDRPLFFEGIEYNIIAWGPIAHLVLERFNGW